MAPSNRPGPLGEDAESQRLRAEKQVPPKAPPRPLSNAVAPRVSALRAALLATRLRSWSLGGVALLAVAAVAFVLGGLFRQPLSVADVATPTAALATQQPIRETVIVTTTPPQPTPDLELTAVAEGDLLQSTALLQRVYSQQPNRNDLQAELAKRYVQLGQQALALPDLALALDRFTTALAFQPLDPTALVAQRRVRLYRDGQSAYQQQQWAKSIDTFEQLRTTFDPAATFDTFLDAPKLLYTAYVNYGDQVALKPDAKEAERAYNAAKQLPGADIADLNAKLAKLPQRPKPTAKPTQTSGWVFAVQLTEKPTDAAVACGTSFKSKVWGIVRRSNGAGIPGATIEVKAGNNTFKAITNSQGGFEVPGLGCTTWRVRLVAVPNAPSGTQFTSFAVNLNGGEYSGAGFVFRQQ